MGVVTIVTIDYGRIYGPLPKSSIVADPVSHIGSLTNQNSRQKITLQINPDEDKDLNQPMEWLCYIHPAKTEDEQNMEAYIKEGQIYYRALRMIKAHEELFIWYSKDFALLIGIPEIQRPMNGEQLSYICPYCGELYEYPFPLRAHVRFKCPKRRVWSSSEKLVTIPLEMKKGVSPNNEKRGTQENYIYKNCHSATKRGSGDDHIRDYSLAKRNSVEMSESKEISFDCNQNVKPNRLNLEDGHSAFRKVDKTNPMRFEIARSLEQAIPTSSRELSFGMSVMSPSSMSNGMSHLRPSGGVPSNMLMESRLPIFPMMPPLHPAMVQIPRPAMFGAMHLNSVFDNGGSALSAKLKTKNETDLKNIENSNPTLLNSTKTSMPFDKPRTPYSVVRTINPIMEKMMHSVPASMHSPLSSVNVLQNCCAQCSASFRMTSDLVYHMRSHHKREFDPMKRKREEKLRCNICSESFRERHHLTRHMTSHL